jgi:hypothetical protein
MTLKSHRESLSASQPHFEERQRISSEGAETADEGGLADLCLRDGAQADEILEARRQGDLGIVDVLEAARRPLERVPFGKF